MNDKTKVKQFFALLLLSTFGFIMMCASGCGSQGSTQSCEKFDRIKGTTADGRTIDAISIPGCGGICSSGRGCGFDTCGIWNQSIKYVKITDRQGHYTIFVDNLYFKNKGCVSSCSDRQELHACYGLTMSEREAAGMGIGKDGSEIYAVDASTGSVSGCCEKGPLRLVINGEEIKYGIVK